MLSAKAVVFEARDTVNIREVRFRDPDPAMVVVETLLSFVSPGTELRVLDGHYGAADKFPLVPGYSTVGRVVEVGAQAAGYRVGDLVSCHGQGWFADVAGYWGGQAGLHLHWAAGDGAPVLLPEGAAPEDYAIAEVAAISRRGAASARPQPGEKALIIGQGMIGTFSETFLRLAGCRTAVCDYVPARLDAALRRGASLAVDLTQEDAEARLKAAANSGYDIVVEASGSTPGVRLAHRMLRAASAHDAAPWPRLVMQASYIAEVPLEPHDFFPGDGVTLLTPLDRSFADRAQVVETIRTGRLDPRDFPSEIYSLDQMPGVYRALRERKISSAICRWRD